MQNDFRKQLTAGAERLSMTLLACLLVGCGNLVGDASDATAQATGTSEISVDATELETKLRQARSSAANGQIKAGKLDTTVTSTSSIAKQTTDASVVSLSTLTTTPTTDPTSLTISSGTSVTTSTSTSTVPKTVSSGTRLLQQSDFQLLGRFRMPLGGSGLASTTYTRGGMAIGTEGSSPSLFIAGTAGGTIAYGGNPDINVGEVNVPATLSLSTDFRSLPVASFKQPMTNVLEGKIRDVFAPETADSNKLEIEVRGLFKEGDKLLVNAVVAYDTNLFAVAGHFSRPADLSVKGAVSGPVRVAPQIGPRHTPGPMYRVPQQLQNSLGWPSVATGVNGLSINGTISNGPGVVLFNPQHIEGATPRSSIAGNVLSDYPHPGNTFANAMGFTFGMSDATASNQNPWWTPVNHTRGGGAWPAQFQSVLFMGQRGLGAPFYGVGSNPPVWGVADMVNSNQAPHAYPYQHVMYMFDQSELIAVNAGQKSASSVRAYAAFELPDPFGQATPSYFVCGSALDSITIKLYILKCNVPGTYGETMVEVYQLPAQ